MQIPFDDYAGVYMSDSGEHMLVSTNGQHLRYLRPLTGDYRECRPAEQDRFTAGPGMLEFEPVEIKALFQRDAAGAITLLLWEEAGAVQHWTRDAGPQYEAVTFFNGDIRLAGQLVRPPDSGPHPAIVLIHGSGPAQWWRLQTFAEYFALLGVATLIHDKRGVGGSTGDWHDLDFDALAHDTLAGVEYLRARSDVIGDQIGLWGISQGGWLAQLAASLSSHVKFIIPVSGPAVTPAEQELYRADHQLRFEGFPEAAIAQAVTLYEQLLNVWRRQGEGWEQCAALIDQYRDEAWLPYLIDLEHLELKDLLQIKCYDYDPLPTLRRVQCPVLAVFGARDVYVPVERSARLLREALSAAGNRDFTVVTFPDGDHEIRRPGRHGQTSAPGFVPEYLALMRGWLQQRLILPQQRT